MMLLISKVFLLIVTNELFTNLKELPSGKLKVLVSEQGILLAYFLIIPLLSRKAKIEALFRET